MENQTLALIASFIAMAFVVMAYFVKKKAYYLLCQLLCIVFLVVSYFFTVQFFAMIGLAVGLLRTVTFFVYENKEKQAPHILVVYFLGVDDCLVFYHQFRDIENVATFGRALRVGTCHVRVYIPNQEFENRSVYDANTYGFVYSV